MSDSGPAPSRLDELRRDFHEAALNFPNVRVVVVHRPSGRVNPADSEVLDRSDAFVRGFLRVKNEPSIQTDSHQVIGLLPFHTPPGNDELAANVHSWLVSMPPYLSRNSVSPSDQVDWEGIVRESLDGDAHAARPYWQSMVIFCGATQYHRWDMLASDAARLLLGGNGRTGTPTADWTIHLAELAEPFATYADRLVMIPSRPPPRNARQPVVFSDCPPERRWEATENLTPSWWVVTLDNVFRLSRDVIDRALTPKNPNGRTVGRPRDENKQKVVEFVREQRAQDVPWKQIPAAVQKQFGVKYTAETLRGYLKDG